MSRPSDSRKVLLQLMCGQAPSDSRVIISGDIYVCVRAAPVTLSVPSLSGEGTPFITKVAVEIMLTSQYVFEGT